MITIKFDYTKGSRIWMLVVDSDANTGILEAVVSTNKPADPVNPDHFWKPVSTVQLGGAANKTVIIDQTTGNVIRIEN